MTIITSKRVAMNISINRMARRIGDNMKNEAHNKVIALGSTISVVITWIGLAIFITIDQLIISSQNGVNFDKNYLLTNFLIGCCVTLIPSLISGIKYMRHIIHEIELNKMSNLKAIFLGGLIGLVVGLSVCILVWIIVAVISSHRTGLNYHIFLIRSIIGMIISMITGGLAGIMLFNIVINRLSKTK